MANVVLVRMPGSLIEENLPEIPDKLYFRIGEVSRLVGVPQYVLRFWEKEFPALSPKKSGKGHRLYRRKDVELFLEVKRLLYEKRFTIEGARKFLESKPKSQSRKSGGKAAQGGLFESTSDALAQIRTELAAILKMLK